MMPLKLIRLAKTSYQRKFSARKDLELPYCSMGTSQKQEFLSKNVSKLTHNQQNV